MEKFWTNFEKYFFKIKNGKEKSAGFFISGKM